MQYAAQLRLVCSAVVIAGAVACSAGSGDDSAGGAGGSGSDVTSAGNTVASGAAVATTTTGGFMTSATGAGGSGEVAEVFGHSDATLYRLDPNTKVVTTVADFGNCGGSVIDIALDKDSNLYATTSDGLYHVDKMTAACTLIQLGTYPNSLSFVPAGTLDPNVEALVGYQGDQYVRIDPSNGAVTNIGAPWNNGLLSSGDIVSVKNGKSYLTVNGANCGDCLIEVDPATGTQIKNWGQLGFSSVWGIAFWAGSVFGFTADGKLFEVSFPNNALTTTLIVAPSGVSFWGAGSTTSAPPTAN